MSAKAVEGLSPILHREALALAETETQRLLALIDELDDTDWSRTTDCSEWDVRALVSHLLGNMCASASLYTLVRQFALARRDANRSGRPMLDELNARQVAEHASMSPPELVRAIQDIAPAAVRGRRRTPGFVRALKINPGPPVGAVPVGYLVDVALTFDMWMHRTDLARATGRQHVLTAAHDGRLIETMVAGWATAHGQPFMLMLTGPAGGTFAMGSGGPRYDLDAVEFARILTGRAPAHGLLRYSRFRTAKPQDVRTPGGTTK